MLSQFSNYNKFSPLQLVSCKHLILELFECSRSVLDDKELLFSAMKEGAEFIDEIVINQIFHQFEPSGVSGFMIMADSHLSIRTWPDNQKASIDFYTNSVSSLDGLEKIFMN